jgi:large subunit ribosomal protein L1
MSKSGKQHRKALEDLQKREIGTWKDGLDTVVKTAHVKFDETVDASIILGIDPAKGEQVVRGSVLLPHGTGKKLRIVVFAKGEQADKAVAAGVDYVGLDDLVEKILGGWVEFDVALATPDVMGAVGKAARVLGPRGLLPNKKVGTVTDDIAAVVSDLKKGRVSFRNDKNGIVNVPFGKVSFGPEKLLDNLKSLVRSIVASKPSSSKGKYLKKVVVSSTMGVGVKLNPDEAI